MKKLQDIEFFPESFFVGALFPFVEDGKLFLLTVQQPDKYKSGQINTKLPGGSSVREMSSDSKYFDRLEEVLNALSFERRAVLLILNQEYSRRAQHAEHPNDVPVLWLLQTLVLNCLEATGYYPADLDPWVVDIMERSEDHYQYFLEVKEWWDRSGNKVEVPAPDDDFVPLDKDIVASRHKLPILEFEELLIGSHRRPVEFYIEHLKNLARQVRKDNKD